MIKKNYKYWIPVNIYIYSYLFYLNINKYKKNKKKIKDVPTCELNKLDVYKTACKIIDVIPISYYADNMNNEELIMRNHGLGPKGAKAISESLNVTT